MDFYTAIVVLIIAMVAVNGIDICTNRVIGKNMKRHSVITCVLIVLAMFFEWVGVKTNGAALSLLTIHQLAKWLEFSLAPLIAMTATVSYSRIRHPKLMILVMTAHAIFEAVALHFGWVINIDGANVYHRGFLYPIYIAVFSLSILYCVVSVLKTDLRHYTKPSLILLAILAFLILGISFQMVDSDIRTVYICVAVSNYFFYNHRCKMILQMDGLTYLLNRRCFEKDIEKIKPPLGVLVMDVDDFKSLNDTYGHMFGDDCLKEIAAVIQSVFGKFGTCYRYGGDEFCVIMTKHPESMEQQVRIFTERMKQKQAEDERIPGVSIGYSGCETPKKHILDTIEEADRMLYQVKTEKKRKA